MFDELTLNKMEENRNNTRISNYLRDYIYKPENVAIKAKMEEYQKKQNKAGLDSIMNAITIIINEQHKYETKFQYSKEQRVAYKTIGGTPLLDGEYTVFGEVIVGLDIVDKIAAYTVGANDRPKIDIRVIGMKVVKK